MAEDTKHDVFEGEIPKDLGKKSPPIWIKGAGLVVLVGVLGSAALMLESNDDFAVEPGVDITDSLSSHLPSVSTSETSEIELQSSPGRNLNEIDVAMTASDISIPEEQINILEMERGDNAITITPRQDPSPEAAVTSSEFVKDELRQEVSQLTSRLAEIEASESERITVVKSGIELHAQSVEKLNVLVRSLEGLKKELSALKTAPVSAAAPATVRARQATPEKSNPQAKPVEPKEPHELSLLGIDTWGGERFAQIEFAGQIHLLASNESIGSWRLDSIAKDSVVVKNREGESFELNI